MDEHFTNNAQAAYLASLTQAKKILYLQKQLANCQCYTKTIQQDLQATKLTLNRLIKQRTNHQILAKMSQNLYAMQRRCRQMQELLKQNNGKLLIQMQLRIQEKAQYSQKAKQLQQQIQLIRKTNKDKQQQFTNVVNKLRKYQEIRQLMLEDKLNKQTKDMINIKNKDKDQFIKQLSQQLNYYKNIVKNVRVDVDMKVATLTYALENQKNYQRLKQEFLEMVNSHENKHRFQKLLVQRFSKEKQNVQNLLNKSTPSPGFASLPAAGMQHFNLNQNTKQLVKQLKKLAVSNKILQSALNNSIQKNRQLILINQILTQSNTQLKQQLAQYHKKQYNILFRKSSGISSTNYLTRSHIPDQNKRRQFNSRKSDNSNIFKSNKQFNEIKQIRQSRDDFVLGKSAPIDIPTLVRQRKLKKYLETLKSQDYQVNIQGLYKDVNRMSQFLILSLGGKSKELKVQNKDRSNYSQIMQKANKKQRVIRSISGDAKQNQKMDAEIQSQKKINFKKDDQKYKNSIFLGIESNMFKEQKNYKTYRNNQQTQQFKINQELQIQQY